MELGGGGSTVLETEEPTEVQSKEKHVRASAALINGAPVTSYPCHCS